MFSLGWDPAKGRRLLSVYLVLNVFTKICMPLRGYLPNPCPMEAVDSRVICSVGEGRVAAARVLPWSCCGKGLAVELPWQGSCRGY